MFGLKTLCAMQLKDKMDFSYLKSTKKTIFKVVLAIIKFAIITALIWLAFYILNLLRLVSILPGIPQNFFSVLLTIMLLLSIIVCTFGLVKSLYFAKDNFVLLTLPVSRTKVFMSKLLVYYIYEFIRNLSFLLPLFVALGIINSMPFYYYIWLIPSMFIVTFIPVSLGAILSIPMLYIGNFVRTHKWLEYTLIAIAIAGVSILLILLINAIPENFDLIGTWGTTFWKVQTFIDKFNVMFTPFTWIATAIIGTRYGVSNILFGLSQIVSLLIIIGIIMVIIGLTFIIVRPLYFYMSSSPFEYRKKKITKVYKNSKANAFWSSVKKDLFINYRTPEKFYSLIFIIIGLPLSIFLLNKIYSAMDTRLSGTLMAVAFNILLMLLIVLSSNVNMAHVYSEEGGANYLLKTNPKPYLNTLITKLFINAFGITISLIITIAIFASFMGLSVLQAILVFLFVESVYCGHLLWSAELDIMNPQTQRYQTEGMYLNNPNDLKSTIYAFVLSALFAFITYFLIGESERVIWLKLFVIAVAFMIFRVWSFVNKINVYYKEKG